MTKTPLWPDHVCNHVCIERCRSLLNEKLSSLGKPIDITCLEVVRGDEMDTVVNHQHRDLLAWQLTTEARLKRSILAALQRIKQLEYGYCMGCDEVIPFNRLMAIPWAERCVKCQEQHDLNNKEESLEPDLLSA